MTIQEEFEYFYQTLYGVKPVFLVESKVYALHNQQIAYECFLSGRALGYDAGYTEGYDDGWKEAKNYS